MRNGLPGAPEPQLYTGIICRSAAKVKRFVFWTGRDRNCVSNEGKTEPDNYSEGRLR